MSAVVFAFSILEPPRRAFHALALARLHAVHAAVQSVHVASSAAVAPMGPTWPAGHGVPEHDVSVLQDPALYWPDGQAAQTLQVYPGALDPVVRVATQVPTWYCPALQPVLP